MIYFLQAGASGPIKIGTSITGNRVKHLQTSCPYPAHLLAQVEGGRELERRIHKALRAERSNGEWFKPLRRTVAVLNAAKAGPSTLEQALHALEAEQALEERRRRAVGAAVLHLIAAAIHEVRKSDSLAQICKATGLNDAEILRFARAETDFGVTKYFALEAAYPPQFEAVWHFIEQATVEALESVDTPESAHHAIAAQLARIGPKGDVA